MKNTVTSPREFMYLSIRGMRYESSIVGVLSLPFSIQNRSVPSFFGTKTISAVHPVCASSMTDFLTNSTTLTFLDSLVSCRQDAALSGRSIRRYGGDQYGVLRCFCD